LRIFRIALIVALVSAEPSISAADYWSAPPPSGIHQTDATLSGVLALNAKAVGKPLDSFATRVFEWSYVAGGVAGTQRTIAVGGDYLTTDTHGPFVTLTGKRNGLEWQQNENGLTYAITDVHQRGKIDAAALAAAARGDAAPNVTLLGETDAPNADYVVEVRPPDGRPDWLYYDKQTGLLVRQVEQFWNVRGTTIYDDYRPVHGAVIAWRRTYKEGDPANDEEWTLKSAELDAPVNVADLNIPPDRRALVEFPAGTKTVDLPVRLVDGGWIVRVNIGGKGYDFLLDSVPVPQRGFDFIQPDLVGGQRVRVNIGGKGYDFLLDSGSSNILIDKGTADRLGLERIGRHSQAIGGDVLFSQVIIPEMHIGGLTMKNIVAESIPWTESQLASTRVVGLLGFDFIAGIGLRMDYQHGTIDASSPGNMIIPNDGIKIPIKLDDAVPMVPARVNDAIGTHFILDTGSTEIMIFSTFAGQHHDDVADVGQGKNLVQNGFRPDFRTVGGGFEAVPMQIKRFVFGRVEFDDTIVFVTRPESHFEDEDVDGLIGYQFLRHFTLYFDYDNSRIVVVPNDRPLHGSDSAP